MRAFLALEIPSEIRSYLESTIGIMAARMKGIRWVKQDGLHITLKFLGEIETDMARRIREALPRIGADYDPFPVSIKGIDAFPDRRRARVVVVALGEGVPKIEDIFRDVEMGLSMLDIAAEERKYTPHITLGRAKVPGPLLDKDCVPLEGKRFMVDKLVLFRSALTREGALYSPVWDIKFGGRG